VRRLAEQGNHCDHHRDLGGIWNMVAIAIAGERIVSEFSPDVPGIPTCDTPTRLCAYVAAVACPPFRITTISGRNEHRSWKLSQSTLCLWG
jgi:hypothetical protein